MASSRTKSLTRSFGTRTIRPDSNINGRGSSVEEPASRRLACDACRDRKIRCNRQHSSCARCVKMGITCRYSARSKPAPSRMDISRFLMSLDNRLKQTEAQLATYTSLWETTFGSVAPAVSNVPLATIPSTCTSYLNSPLHPSEMQTNPEIFNRDTEYSQTLAEWPTVSPNDDFEFDLSAFTSTPSLDAMMLQPIPDETRDTYSDSMFLDTFSTSFNSGVGELLLDTLFRLHDTFFDVFHHIIPIINRKRLEVELLRAPLSFDVEALSYAIALLGSISTPELRCHTDICYEHVRVLLDKCERQESDKYLRSINTLQACTLLAFYELKRPNFARAWMALGRAIRLAKMMGLEQIDDGKSDMISRWGNGLQRPLTSSSVDSEEHRRTFWALFVFDAFASIRTTSSWAFSNQISVTLPGPSDFPGHSVGSDLVAMPCLQGVFTRESPGKAQLSSFAGVVIMISLYRQCFDHMKSPSPSTICSFWETHYKLEKAITRCRSAMLGPYLNGQSSDDPNCLTLRMNLDTVEINLHKTALLQTEMDQLPATLAVEASSKCTASIVDMVAALKIAEGMNGTKRDQLEQLNCFLVWPISTAIESCLNLLDRSFNTGDANANCLRVFTSVSKTLLDSKNLAPGLLEKADARLAEFERGGLN